MKKIFGKAVTMFLAVMMTVSAMSIGAFAAEDTNTKIIDTDIQVVAIDQDGNERVIPLFYSEEAAQISEQMSKQRAGMAVWNWSNGNYEMGFDSDSHSYSPIPYVFTPSSTGRLTLNSILYNCTATSGAPYVNLNNYTKEQNGTNGYVGSFDYDNISGSTYQISYTIKNLTTSNTYRFFVYGNGRWNNGSFRLSR